MELYTLVYIHDRDVNVEVKTFRNLEDAIRHQDKLVRNFLEDYGGVASLTTNQSEDECFCYLEGGHTNIQIHIIKTNLDNKYPFNEGDTYYTLEVVESCWDDASEDMHDDNPNRLYFKTREEALTYIKENK